MIMEKVDQKVYFFAFFLLIAYLLWNTGVFSDDIPLTLQVGSRGLQELITPKFCVATPAENYFFYIWYPFLKVDEFALISLLKICYVALSFYCVARFFSLFTGLGSACLFSFLFIFFPSHDATVYWFLGEFLMLSAAFYLYSFYLVERNRIIPAIIFALLGSFISYGSPALAVGLSLVFCLRRELKKAAVLLVPNILYCGYYFAVMRLIKLEGIDRIPVSFAPSQFLKSFVLQVATFTDAVLGPSMWLKISYSILQLSIVTTVVGIVMVGVAAVVKGVTDRPRADRALLAGLFAITGISFAMFALTGRYPQIAFNLGNRVTIFGSLLIVYLIMVCPARIFRVALICLLMASILGLSDHWKVWSAHQRAVIRNMATNEALASTKDDIVYITGNQYSRLGRIGHVDFLSEPPVTSSLMKHVTTNHADGLPLTGRCRLEGDSLVDTKYGVGYPVGEDIAVYDSEKNVMLRVKKADIPGFINSLPRNVRHWMQLINDDRVKRVVVHFMPYLKYAFSRYDNNS